MAQQKVDGSQISTLNLDLSGSDGSGIVNLNASNLTSGSVPNAQISQVSVTQHQGALTLSTGQITSGTFADARISQTSVTQHQGAISHDALLNVVATEHTDHGTVSITGTTSLTGGGTITTNRTLTLVNDSATPGNDMLYGTNGSGVKGWYAQPASGSDIQFSKWKTSSQIVNNSTTLVTDSQLDTGATLPVGKYDVELLITGLSSTVADFKFHLVAVNENLFDGMWIYPDGAGGMNYQQLGSDPYDNLVVPGAGVGSPQVTLMFKGTLSIFSAGGRLYLEFAQNVAEASNTQVQIGSMMKLTILN